MGASANRNSEQRNASRVFIPHLQLFSANSSRRLFSCGHRRGATAPASPAYRRQAQAVCAPKTLSFLGAILQQILKLAHEFLDVLKVNVHAREAHVRYF